MQFRCRPGEQNVDLPLSRKTKQQIIDMLLLFGKLQAPSAGRPGSGSGMRVASGF